MFEIKISIITVTYNAEKTIDRCIRSVLNQDYQSLEYLVIDGASTDGTLSQVNRYKQSVALIKSERDNGIYDAINKGIALATGQIIGMLNSDDYFGYPTVVSDIVQVFRTTGTDILYGDLDYVNKDGNVVRKWRSGKFKPGRLNWGWMPPHPTFYCKAELYKKFGLYRLDFGTAADYELMIRFMCFKNVQVAYLQQVMVKMQLGGASNVSFKHRLKVLRFDFKAMRLNNFNYPFLTVILKPFRKLIQYF